VRHCVSAASSRRCVLRVGPSLLPLATNYFFLLHQCVPVCSCAQVCETYQLNSGTLQQLQRNAAMFYTMAKRFCVEMKYTEIVSWFRPFKMHLTACLAVCVGSCVPVPHCVLSSTSTVVAFVHVLRCFAAATETAPPHRRNQPHASQGAARRGLQDRRGRRVRQRRPRGGRLPPLPTVSAAGTCGGGGSARDCG
jgi:hypothetical protein